MNWSNTALQLIEKRFVLHFGQILVSPSKRGPFFSHDVKYCLFIYFPDTLSPEFFVSKNLKMQRSKVKVFFLQKNLSQRQQKFPKWLTTQATQAMASFRWFSSKTLICWENKTRLKKPILKERFEVERAYVDILSLSLGFEPKPCLRISALIWLVISKVGLLFLASLYHHVSTQAFVYHVLKAR